MFPWLDHHGRLLPLKLVVFSVLFVPAAWTVAAFALDALGPRPLNEAIHQFGLWGVRLLLISLAITPARQLLHWPSLSLVRRMIGVAAFFYIAVHFTLYVGDQGFDLAKVASEIVLRFYLFIGFTALLGLAALAATSTGAMTRRLGGRRWQRLHQTIYATALLAVIHYYMQAKLEVFEPMFFAGFFLWLMAFRLVARLRRDKRVPLWAVAGVSVASTVLTALGEAGYFWLKTGVDPGRVLLADLSLDTGVRPAWIVLAAGIAFTALAAFRSLAKRGLLPRLRPA